MTDVQVLAHVRQVFADLFARPLEEVVEDLSQDTLENWDSLQHLNVVLALEGAFSVEFVPEEIEAMTSIEAIVETLRAKLILSGHNVTR